MQTDRQDLDKRYINLLCVEPHITFPPCNGSLKLTEYGFDVNYEDETDCADVNKTCTEIDKFISKRPEVGDEGGEPPIVPDPVETGDLSGDYSFAKSSELDDGRLLTIHYGNPSQYKVGGIKLTLLNIPASGDPTHSVTIDIETPGGSPISAREDVDVITFGSDTFVIAYHDTGLGESKLLKGSISSGVPPVITFDSYVRKIADQRMYSANFVKLGSDAGFAIFINLVLTTAGSAIMLAYTYSGGVFTEFINKKTIIAAFPVSLGLPGPPLYAPPDACGGSVVYNYVKQFYSFNVALVKETDDYYQFAGGYMQVAVINYVQILNAWGWCLPLPAPITKTIFVPTSIKIYKSDGSVLYWHTETYWRKAGGLIGYLEFKRLGSTQRAVGIYPAVGDDGHIVIGLELSGNYAIPRRAFKFHSVTVLTDGGIYSFNNEYFGVAITGAGGVTDFYPVIWLENNNFFGYLGEGSKVVIAGGSTVHLRGITMSNGRVCVLRTYSGYYGWIYLLDIGYV